MDANSAGLIGTWIGTGISVLAFIASLILYIKGRDLHDSANRALVELSERSGSIQSDLRTVSDTMLPALLKRVGSPSAQSDEIDQALESLRSEIKAISEKATVGRSIPEEEVSSLFATVGHIQGLVEVYRNMQQDYIDGILSMILIDTDNSVLKYLSDGQHRSFKDIRDHVHVDLELDKKPTNEVRLSISRLSNFALVHVSPDSNVNLSDGVLYFASKRGVKIAKGAFLHRTK